jgi:hypothetical protein
MKKLAAASLIALIAVSARADILHCKVFSYQRCNASGCEERSNITDWRLLSYGSDSGQWFMCDESWNPKCKMNDPAPLKVIDMGTFIDVMFGDRLSNKMRIQTMDSPPFSRRGDFTETRHLTTDVAISHGRCHTPE